MERAQGLANVDRRCRIGMAGARALQQFDPPRQYWQACAGMPTDETDFGIARQCV